MQKYIIKPLEFDIPELDKTLKNKILIEPNMYLLIGKSKVGKTALCFKLINELFHDHPKLKQVGYFHFDNTHKYWIGKCAESVIFPSSKISFHHIVVDNNLKFIVQLKNHLDQNTYSLIVIDVNINELNKFSASPYKDLLSELMKLIHKFRISIIVTERANLPAVMSPVFQESKNTPIPEKWLLDRPEYYGINDITEFGQTRLYVW